MCIIIIVLLHYVLILCIMFSMLQPFETQRGCHPQIPTPAIIVGTRSQAVQMPGVLNPVPTNILTSVPTTGICTHMGFDTTWKLRVSEEELHEWKQRSAADG